MNRLAARMTKLKKVQCKGRWRVHFLIIDPGKNPEQTKSLHMTENDIGENDDLFIMDLFGER